MTYQAFEVSPSAGNPAELYQFALSPAAPGGSGFVIPPPPAAPGNLIVGDLLLSGTWALVRDVAQTSLSGTYPPVSPDSYAAWPGASGQWEVWGAFHGSIGGGLSYFYMQATVGPTLGLAAGTNYVLRVLGQNTSGGAPPIFGLDVGAGLALPGLPANAEYPATHLGWQDYPFTSDGAGNVTIKVGALDLEVGTSGILFMPAMVLFDATGTPAGGGSPAGTGAAASFVPTVLNYTSADIDITYGGVTYVHKLIERQNFTSKQDGLSKSEFDVALDLDNPIAQQWFVSGHLPVAPITCRILRVHVDDLTDAATPFYGQVIRSKIQGKKVILTLASVERLTERRIPRVFNQRLCNNFLGDAVCRVDLMAKSFTTGTVSAITTGGFVVTVPGAQAFAGSDLSYYKDGVLIAPDGARGWIVGHAGDVLTLADPIPSLAVGQAVIVQPGCDLSWRACAVKFENTANRRAMDLIPNRNPFVGAGLL